MWYCLLCSTRWFYLLSLWKKTQCVTVQMKAIEQYFHVVLFIVLFKVVLTLSLWMKQQQYFHLVLFIIATQNNLGKQQNCCQANEEGIHGLTQRSLKFSTEHRICTVSGRGTPLHQLCRYVRPHRVRFLISSHKQSIDLSHFGHKQGMVLALQF